MYLSSHLRKILAHSACDMFFFLSVSMVAGWEYGPPRIWGCDTHYRQKKSSVVIPTVNNLHYIEEYFRLRVALTMQINDTMHMHPYNNKETS